MKCKRRSNYRSHLCVGRRRGFTLLELILSLALAAVIAGVMGSLITMFLMNQEVGHDNVRQAQLARAVLNMIAEDVRTTVRYQPFDSSGLQQLLSGGGGGGGQGGGATAGAQGGASGAGSASGGQGASGGISAGGGGSASGGGTGASSSGMQGGGGSAGAGASASNGATPASLPPGVYGTMTSIEIDVSRLPRPDEYVPDTTGVSSGGVGDMPSDIKTVGYYVQAPRTDGVQDALSMFSQDRLVVQGNASAPNNGGLVRRSIDRAVTQYAYENGLTDSLSRSGQIIAPEVVGIEFQYFDGTTWLTEWDSSQQGLPFVIKITIAMQKESFLRSKPLTQGVAISSMTNEMLQEYGVEIYSTNTIIPGAQLLVAPQGTSATGSTDTGMGAMGL